MENEHQADVEGLDEVMIRAAPSASPLDVARSESPWKSFVVARRASGNTGIIIIVVTDTDSLAISTMSGFASGWQSGLRSAIDRSRSRASQLSPKQQPTSVRDECPAGSGILQVNYSLEWVARQGVGWHAHHWGTPAPRRHLSPYASMRWSQTTGYVAAYMHECARIRVRVRTYVTVLACAWRFSLNLCHRLDVLRNRQFSPRR